MSEATVKIISIINAIRRSWIRRESALLACVGGIAAILWLASMIVIDNTTMLGARGLLIGWSVAFVLIAITIAAMAYRLTRGRPDDRRLAMLFESRVPQQHNRLINSVDFIQSKAVEADPMARAAVVENAIKLDPALAPGAIDWRRVRHAATTAGVCLTLLVGYFLFRAPFVINAVARLLDPLDPRPHLLLTGISVSPGDAHLVEGDSLAIDAKLDRYLPNQASVEYRVNGHGEWTRAPMQRQGESVFRYEGLKGVWQDLQYRVVAGRSTSATYAVSVTPRPKVQSVQLHVTPPAYTGAVGRALPKDQGDVASLAGSVVLIDVTSSAKVSAAKLELSDGTLIALSPQGNTASGSFTLRSAGSYAIVIADSSTPKPLENLSPPRYAITVQEDQPPAAVFTAPGRDLILAADATIPLKLEAEDDWGLANVAIQVKSIAGDWTTIASADLPVPGEKRKTITADLSLAGYKLKSGEVLLYRAVASDHRQPTRNTFVGRPWSIAIAGSTSDALLLSAEAKKVLESLQAILALQKDARSDVDMDREIPPIRQKQSRVREMTLAELDRQHKSIRPMKAVIDDLTDLAEGPMPKATSLLADFVGTYEQRLPKKAPIITAQDQIIAKLESLIGQVSKSIVQADKAQQALEKLSPKEKEEALKQVRDLLEKLRNFIPEQDKVIDDTKELLRKADNFTKDDLQKIEKLQGTEDAWAKVFNGNVDEMNKLLQQGFANASIHDDYKQMVEQIEEAAKDLNPKITTMVVPREQTALELATQLKEDMEMWLPATPDNIKWVMEEPLKMPDVPMPPLPDNLKDMIGDLIAQEDAMTEQADDQTSSWADSISAAGWGASDGPISNFSAKGVTGNQLPNNQELSGRAGDGRGGKSSGQMVSDVAKGLDGRKLPTRITNDPYEQGVVKELQQTPTGGSTGGGKARGSGQEGLQGSTPPPNFDKTQFMKDWQQRLRQQAERLAGQLKAVHLHIQELDDSIESMKRAEAAMKEGRYRDFFKAQQMVLQQLQAAQDLAARDASLHLDRAYNVPADRKKPVMDAGDEPVPSEYHGAVKRYFEELSQEK